MLARRSILSLLALLTLVLLGGCETTSDAAAEWQPFTGRVVYVSKLRGFWGIEARKLGKINPISLPEEFQVEGLIVSGEVLLQPDIMSAKRWGTVGEVRNLKAAE